MRAHDVADQGERTPEPSRRLHPGQHEPAVEKHLGGRAHAVLVDDVAGVPRELAGVGHAVVVAERLADRRPERAVAHHVRGADRCHPRQPRGQRVVRDGGYEAVEHQDPEDGVAVGALRTVSAGQHPVSRECRADGLSARGDG